MEYPIDFPTLVEETVHRFQKISFRDIDNSWVSEAWTCGYSDCSDYNPSAELLLPENDVIAINELCRLCELWSIGCSGSAASVNNDLAFDNNSTTDADDTTQENLFTTLLNCDIPIQNVISFIYLFCTKGSKPSSTLHEKEVGLCFARFYFMLLCVPASTAYRVYHPNVFEVAVNCLKLPKEKSVVKRNSTTNHQDSPSKRRRCNTFESDTPSESDRMSDFQDSQEPHIIENHYNHREYIKIIDHMSFSLLALVELLRTFSLRRDQDVVEHTIQQLVECSSCETEYSNVQFQLAANEIKGYKIKYGASYVVSSLAFNALIIICDPKHGNGHHNYLKVMKHLAHNILLSSSRSNHIVARKYSVIKDNSAAFVSYNMKQDPEKYYKNTRTLLQQLCVKVQEKSDVRLKIAVCIISILKNFPHREYCRMLDWFQRLMLNVKVQCRVFGLELFAQILSQVGETIKHSTHSSASFFGMIDCLISRCNDKATSVRTKALTVLGNHLKCILKLLKCANNLGASPECDSETGVENCRLPGEGYRGKIENMVSMLHRRIVDDKVYVRKAALHALETVISVDRHYLNQQNLMAFQESAEDGNLSIRKQILQSLTAILQSYMSIDLVQRMWLESVLPLILDPESSVQEKCLEVLEAVIFQNIYARSNNEHAWNIIMHIAVDKQQYLQRYLEKAIFMLTKTQKIGSGLPSALIQQLGSIKDPAVWLLLSEIVPYSRIKNPSYIVDYFIRHENDIAVSTMKNVLKVIGHTSKNTEEDKLKQIREKLKHQLRNFSVPHELISRSVEALHCIYKALYKEEVLFQKNFTEMSVEIMKDCEKYLSSVVLKDVPPECAITEDQIVSWLFTLGEFAQLCPSALPKNSQLLLQSIIASHLESDSNSNGSHSPSPLNQIITPKVQAHAFITMGKLCLQNEDFAKKCLPAFVKEVLTSEHFVIKINVIVIMVDLCIRYTSLVDPYIPTLTSCLRDPSPMIRRQTLTLLTQLLQEDFIKLKGSMFFRMLSTYIDDSSDIRKDAQYVLGHQLLRRQPTIFFQYFVESIFHFNNYKLHTTYNQFCETEKEEKLFSLKGNKNKHKRMALYKFMLDHMKDEERFHLNLKLCQEILSPVVDEVIPLDDNSINLVKDCLAVLSCEEIKLSTLTANTHDEAEDGDAAALLAKAKKCIVSQVVKKNVIENIVPIVISLKHIFSKKKSPLLYDVMAFLKELLKDYKNEIKEIMAGEKQLAKEIEFDMKNFEKQQEMIRNRAEQRSSVTENIRTCDRSSRSSCERQAVRRHSALEVVHGDFPLLSANPTTRHERGERHERRPVRHLSSMKVVNEDSDVVRDAHTSHSLSAEQQNTSLEVNDVPEDQMIHRKEAEKCMSQSVCNKESSVELAQENFPVSSLHNFVSCNGNHLASTPSDQHVTTVEVHNSADSPLNRHNETEMYGKQLPSDIDCNTSTPIPSSKEHGARVQLPKLFNNLAKSSVEHSDQVNGTKECHSSVSRNDTDSEIACTSNDICDVTRSQQNFVRLNAKNCDPSSSRELHYAAKGAGHSSLQKTGKASQNVPSSICLKAIKICQPKHTSAASKDYGIIPCSVNLVDMCEINHHNTKIQSVSPLNTTIKTSQKSAACVNSPSMHLVNPANVFPRRVSKSVHENSDDYCDVPKSLQPVLDKPLGVKHCSTTFRSFSSRMKSPVVCLERLAPTKQTTAYSKGQELSDINEKNRTRRSSVSDQGMLVGQQTSKVAQRVTCTNTLSSFASTEESLEIKCFKKDSGTTRSVVNLKRTKGHCTKETEVCPVNPSENVPFGNLLEASETDTSLFKSSIAVEQSGLLNSTSDKVSHNVNKRTEKVKPKIMDSKDIARKRMHGKQTGNMLNSVLSSSKNLNCLSSVECITEKPSELYSVKVQKSTIHNTSSKHDTPCFPVVCIRKLNCDKILDVNFEQSCNLPSSLSSKANSEECNISDTPTPDKYISSGSISSKNSKPK